MKNYFGPVDGFSKSASGVFANIKIVYARGRR